MQQDVVTFPGMHTDHRHWHSENSMWRDDIEHWRAPHDSAHSLLTKLEELIQEKLS